MTLSRIFDQPDPLRCGCDTGGLLSVDDALARALAMLPAPGPVQSLPLAESTGRVLAAPVISTAPMPPFDNAAMDGYALCHADLAGEGPWVLPVAGRARAGDAPGRLARGAAVRILTGAAIPDGADTVIAQEAVRMDGGRVVLSRRPVPGAHIRRVGEDLMAGCEILRGGSVIGPREAAALASAGCARVPVRQRLRVAILATGSELVEPGVPLGPGQIWNSNRFQLAAALSAAWIERVAVGALPDDPAQLSGAFARAQREADLFVTTGGVSVGDEDHMTRLFLESGGTVHAQDLAMKPGKPLTLGRLGDMVWVGLPGNPVAAYVAWAVIGAPLAGAMAGIAAPGTRKIMARLAHGVTHRAGRCEYRLARVIGHDAQGALRVECLDAPGAHRVAMLAAAEGLVLVPSEDDALSGGALVEFLPF